MTLKHIIFSWAACLTFGAQGSSFTDALDILTNASLGVRAQTLASEATLQEMRNENKLPAPEASFGYLWGDNSQAGNKWDLDVSQSFDWPGSYRARSKAIKHQSMAMDFLNKSATIEARMEGRLLLLQIINAKQILAIDREISADFQALEALAKKEVELENITRIDYNKAVIERINAAASLLTSENRLEELVCSLTALAGGDRALAEKIVIMIGEDYPEETLPPELTDEQIALLDPAIEAANATARSKQQMAKAEKLSRLPGFSIGYAHETEEGGGFNGPKVGITLPFFANKGRAHVQELQAMEAETQNLITISRRKADFATARGRAQKTWLTVEQLRPVVESNADMDLLKKARAAGQISMRDYYLEVNYFLDAHKAYHNALFEYHSALAQLHRFD